MLEEERDRLIIEMHTDIKWLKEWSTKHAQEHSKYIYYFVATAVGVLISLFR
jgi:hypothetical protein